MKLLRHPGVCFHGVLSCGGWVALRETGEGSRAPVPAAHAHRPRQYGNEGRVADAHNEILLQRTQACAVSLRLTLQNHYRLLSSLLGARQD